MFSIIWLTSFPKLNDIIIFKSCFINIPYRMYFRRYIFRVSQTSQIRSSWNSIQTQEEQWQEGEWVYTDERISYIKAKLVISLEGNSLLFRVTSRHIWHLFRRYLDFFYLHQKLTIDYIIVPRGSIYGDVHRNIFSYIHTSPESAKKFIPKYLPSPPSHWIP